MRRSHYTMALVLVSILPSCSPLTSGSAWPTTEASESFRSRHADLLDQWAKKQDEVNPIKSQISPLDQTPIESTPIDDHLWDPPSAQSVAVFYGFTPPLTNEQQISDLEIKLMAAVKDRFTPRFTEAELISIPLAIKFMHGIRDDVRMFPQPLKIYILAKLAIRIQKLSPQQQTKLEDFLNTPLSQEQKIELTTIWGVPALVEWTRKLVPEQEPVPKRKIIHNINPENSILPDMNVKHVSKILSTTP